MPQVHNYLDSELNSASIPHHRQVIITSYKFGCYGNITEWRLATTGSSIVYSIQFQVWRPSPLVEINGCYSLVGSNRFTTVPQDRVVTVSPPPEDRIQFLPRDVLGFYVEGAQRDEAGVVTLSDFSERGDNGYETEEVWYDTIPDYPVTFDIKENVAYATVTERVIL